MKQPGGPPTRIAPAHWKLIVDRIHNRRCVPFLGAGANVESGAYTPGLPVGAQVNRELVQQLIDTADDLQRLARELKPSKQRGSAQLRELLRPRLQDLSRVALHLERLTDTDNLVTQLERILPDTAREPSPLLKALAELPLRLDARSARGNHYRPESA